MEKSKEQIGEILKKAIKGEEDRYAFYHLLAEKSDDTQAKKILGKLSDDETRHKQTLIDLYKKHVSDDLGELPEEGIDSLSEVIKKGQEISKSTELELINLAIEAEIAATKFYHDQRNLVNDPVFREILDKLSKEEHDHYEMLVAERDAISGTHHWFSFDKQRPMEY